MTYRAGEVEVLLTVNDKDLSRADKNVEATGKKIEKNPLKVKADTADALERLDRVTDEAKKLVSKDVALQVNARIEGAEKNLDRTQKRLEYLRSVETELDVSADIRRAERSLSRIESQVDALKRARATMEVDVADEGARQKLRAVADYAGEAGSAGGEDAGENLASGIVGALASIPIAGAVVGIGYAAGQALREAFENGLQVEAGYDRLAALTGLSDMNALRVGRGAAEAYAAGFGESIESNMDLTRLAIQFDLIDAEATTQQSQKVVEGLAGIADVLGEDVQPVARAVTQLLRSGLARSAQEAFDILATGQREGVNLSEDLLDTLSEYASTFESIGLTGGQTLGLLNQGLQAGAPNTDFFADALRELGIRIREGDDATAGFLGQLGLLPDEMQRAFVEGGPAARDALDAIFDRLRDTDPVDRNRIAVGLLGTQFEDLQLDLSRIDLSNAEEQLDGVAGSAQRMFDTLADNDASKIEQARRSIEVAAQGIQGALASAFAEPLGDAADWIASNRGPVLQFFRDLVNGALDFGIAANTAVGDFVSGPLEQMVEGLKNARRIIAPFADTTELDELQDSMRAFGDSTDAGNEKLEEMRDRFNEFIDPQIILGELSDRSRDFASALDSITAAQDGSAEAATALGDQTRAAVDALYAQQTAATSAGQGQSELSELWRNGAGALSEQLRAMGLTELQTWQLIAAYAGIPESEITEILSNAPDEQSKVQALVDRVNTIPDGETTIYADTSPAEEAIRALRSSISAGATLGVAVATSGGIPRANGGPIIGPGGPRDDLVPVMASNGEHMLTAAEVRAAGGHGAIYRLRRMLADGALHLAGGGPVEKVPSATWQTAPPVEPGDVATYRVVAGQRIRVDGDRAEPARVDGDRAVIEIHHHGDNYSYDPSDIAREQREHLARALDAHGLG
ncbi:phage tail tape measure protein [Microbacterium imperiale]|uniref:Phage tail tape measure protein domain-containing protein n=1 Tax=Microbacterium imperiale TaxID=33884 RepID=A0A9W6HFB3_9MICO|nr:phage tail tape measure protein [Microbacterium imperiale]MBP2419669.1 hypothetical protein [Microbacterium imperiale]MDS0198465.1 phage tail tape measure protein [Microbacterium imperiale]BFE40010.1 hypothetical protein GCM10017544_09660 [Microbacterium imperiale]GLJ79015.1 hypothetical protein GCM10017586_06970 [Microbacterium imperiale]